MTGATLDPGGYLDGGRPEDAPPWATWSYRRLKVGRGWTDALVRDFLPEPDRIGRNVFNGKTESRRYLVSRVLEVEATPEWCAAFEQAKKRSEAAKRRVAERGQLPPPGRWGKPRSGGRGAGVDHGA